MNTKKIVVALMIVLAITIVGFFVFKKKAIAPGQNIANFKECAAAGYPVMESYPRQCRTPDGKIFTEQISATPIPTPTPTPLEIIPSVKSLLYENSQFGFKLWYPEGSDVRKEGFEGFLRVTSGGANVAGIFLQSSLFQGTNLGEAVVAIGVSSDSQAAANCGKVADAQEQSRGTANIGGVAFNVFEAVGAAAGNTYESKTYRTVHNSSCYEIVEMLHSGNIGNYPPGTVTEFDKPKFSGILGKIAKTFVFTN